MAKAILFGILTVLMALVAGLITHFDALAHAAGLPVTDAGVSGIIPLWVMTSLRAVAVIGFLLASRLGNLSFKMPSQQKAVPPRLPAGEQTQEALMAQIDYDALATAVLAAMHKAGTLPTQVSVIEEQDQRQPALASGSRAHEVPEETSQTAQAHHRKTRGQQTRSDEALVSVEDGETRLSAAYETMKSEGTRVTGKLLGLRAGVRKQIALAWLRQQQGQGPQQGKTAISAKEDLEETAPPQDDDQKG